MPKAPPPTGPAPDRSSPILQPLRVHRPRRGPVRAHVGVRAERVALRLGEVLRQVRGAIAVEVSRLAPIFQEIAAIKLNVRFIAITPIILLSALTLLNKPVCFPKKKLTRPVNSDLIFSEEKPRVIVNQKRNAVLIAKTLTTLQSVSLSWRNLIWPLPTS